MTIWGSSVFFMNKEGAYVKKNTAISSVCRVWRKTIDFGGWELPVQFSSIKEEHEAVRTRAGLFDVSHMGEFEVKGKDSLAFLQK